MPPKNLSSTTWLFRGSIVARRALFAAASADQGALVGEGLSRIAPNKNDIDGAIGDYNSANRIEAPVA
jgi:hypothetical protein